MDARRHPWKRASEKRHVCGKVRRRRNSRPVHSVGSPPRRARSRSVAPCKLLQSSLTLRTEPLSCAARTLPVCNCVGPRLVELGASPPSTSLRCCVPQRAPSAEVQEAVEGHSRNRVRARARGAAGRPSCPTRPEALASATVSRQRSSAEAGQCRPLADEPLLECTQRHRTNVEGVAASRVGKRQPRGRLEGGSARSRGSVADAVERLSARMLLRG